MPRESTIQVYRSSSTVTPTGLTFGELAYSDVNGAGRFFIGTTAGNSLWIGAGVTTTDISGNSAVLVPTQSAVKSYVDTNLANSSITFTSGGGSSVISLGGTLNVTGAANQVAITNNSGTVTIGLPNDVTIPGNLTVNGTVVTANVDTFVVEDPLIMLGTGNAADSVDLGFYGQYTSGGKRFAGIYRDASDSGKFKFFDNLTGGAEPTTFVNDGGADYTVATIVAKVSGGTF